MIEKAVKSFIGKQDQIPPIFSAKRINGKRAYLSAREGKKIEMKPSEIEIYEIDILEVKLPHELKLRISCSKGTYIRALARDIGEALNSGAYLSLLRRSKIGDFSVENAITVEEFEKML